MWERNEVAIYDIKYGMCRSIYFIILFNAYFFPMEIKQNDTTNMISFIFCLLIKRMFFKVIFFIIITMNDGTNKQYIMI